MVDAHECPACCCTNSGSAPSSIRCEPYECRRQCTDSSPGSPAAARQAANRSSICRGEIRPPRSVSHSAGWLAALWHGRASSRYWASACAVHGITVATARRRGGLPRIALPYRTWHTPKLPSSGAAGFAAKSAASSIAVSRRRNPHP